MDQDTSNSPGKARWRERLGMGSSGNKDLPKISDEFKPVSPPPKSTAAQGISPPSARGHQPVTRPAPMAPRTPGPRTPAPMAPRTPPQAGGRPVTPVPQGAAGLGDRLRAERQAAERLAEQRVAQARGRPLQPPQNLAPPTPKSAAPERPKFSFSPEELAKDKRETPPAPPPVERGPSFAAKPSGASAAPPPPLTPPRPPLGNATAQPQRQPPKSPPGNPPPKSPPGNPPPKPQTNVSPPAGPAFQPRYNGPPQPSVGNYRSLDPPPGSLAPRPKPYADTAAFRDDPLARRPVNREYESYRRGPPQPAYGEEGYPDYRRRPPVPARSRQPAYDEDVNEVFEDDEPQRPQRRRASAHDYNRAYRDYEDGYDAEPPRRRGPWPWLAAAAAIALLAGGIIYYYLTYYKQGQTSANVPVIEAPEGGAKTTPPENSNASSPGTPGAPQPSADQRKQIYDRILGDDEVGGNQVVPTEEQPQTVEPTGDNEGQGAAPIPNPSSGTQDNSNEPLPLPLPPPGEQGNNLPSDANQQTAALGAVNKTAPQPSPEAGTSNTSDSGAPVPGQLANASEQIASSPPPAAEQSTANQPAADQVASAPEPAPAAPPKPAKPKLKVEKKPVEKVAASDDNQEGGVEPLVLVPPAQPVPAQPAPGQPATNATQIAVSDGQPQNVENPATEQKSKSFFGNLFSTTGKRKLTGKAAETADARGTGTSGNWANSPDPNKVPDSSEPQQQVVSVAPQPQPIPEPQPQPQPQPDQQASPSGTGTGYIAQLASFRSEAEALAEFDRLRAKHANVLNGLSPRVVKATVAGAARYRLGVGPLASRADASKVCNLLIAAGERDCLVRGN